MEGGEAKDPGRYAAIMRELGEHHSKDEHVWGDNKKCTFHPDTKCSCGSCSDELQCPGQPYKSRLRLTCPMHHAAYRIECETRAAQADRLIHPELGRGHSNLPEADHAIFTKFRAKHLNIQRLNYIVMTNLGLLQCNMPYMQSVQPGYHWLVELYEKLGLPLYPGIVRASQATVVSALKNVVSFLLYYNGFLTRTGIFFK